jgi:hypothetical protein
MLDIMIQLQVVNENQPYCTLLCTIVAFEVGILIPFRLPSCLDVCPPPDILSDLT